MEMEAPFDGLLVTPMVESLRTTQIAFFRFATPCGFLRGSADKVQGKSIRARLRARETHRKPFVRTSFLGTRPWCLPSPGRPLFETDDRKSILWLGRTGSPVNRLKFGRKSRSRKSYDTVRLHGENLIMRTRTNSTLNISGRWCT